MRDFVFKDGMSYRFQPTCQIEPRVADKLFVGAFGSKSDGCLVEVGANDGWHWSFTWGLAMIGWKAVYVEPVKELFAQCSAEFEELPNTKVLNLAVGPSNGVARLGMGEYGAQTSGPVVVECEQVTLDSLIESCCINPGFDLLVVDVEGGEDGVLAGFDVARWRPKLIIIERPPKHNKIESFGYRTVYSDWINTVYQLP